MAFLYRPTKVYYTDATGKRVPPGTSGATKVTKTLKKWYAKGPPLPPKKKVPLAADKRAAAQMLAELERKIERGETAIGGSVVDASKRPLAEHLADFAADQKAKGVGEEHRGKAIARIRRILTACEMERPVDLDASKVQRFLADLQERGKHIPPLDPAKAVYTRNELAAALDIKPDALTSLIARHRLAASGNGKARLYPRETAEALRTRLSQPAGAQTANHHLAAIKSFVRWMVRGRRLAKNPLESLQAANVKKDLRHDRRILPLAELARLFRAAGESERSFRGLAGQDRLHLYLTACGTGFRAGELATLTPESFALDVVPPVVVLPAWVDKAGRSVNQPLAPGLAEVLRAYLADRPAGQPVWPGSWHERAADMLRIDLDAAGIPYKVDGPNGSLFADFHALRHSFIALLDKTGATLKEAMQLARHSDPRLTMARYGRAQLEDLGHTVGKLPEMGPVRLALPGPAGKGSLADAPRELLEALAVYGLAALLAGWFGQEGK